jgi:hypothetical protein
LYAAGVSLDLVRRTGSRGWEEELWCPRAAGRRSERQRRHERNPMAMNGFMEAFLEALAISEFCGRYRRARRMQLSTHKKQKQAGEGWRGRRGRENGETQECRNYGGGKADRRAGRASGGRGGGARLTEEKEGESKADSLTSEQKGGETLSMGGLVLRRGRRDSARVFGGSLKSGAGGSENTI